MHVSTSTSTISCVESREIQSHISILFVHVYNFSSHLFEKQIQLQKPPGLERDLQIQQLFLVNGSDVLFVIVFVWLFVLLLKTCPAGRCRPTL